MVKSFLENRIGDDVRGLDDALMLLPSDSVGLFEEQKILEFITDNAEDLALVLLGGVNYYTGQVLPMQAITSHCHLYVLSNLSLDRAF